MTSRLRRPAAVVALVATLLALTAAAATAAGFTAAEPAVGSPAVPGVDTVVGVSAPPSSAPGRDTTVTITVANHGTAPATGATVTIPRTPGAVFREAAPPCAQDARAGEVYCPIGTLAVGASTTLSVQYTPSLTGRLVFEATIDQAEPDAAPADNQASATVGVPAAPVTLPGPPAALGQGPETDLGMSVAFEHLAGNAVLYLLKVGNRGRVTDPDVVVTAPVPDHASVLAVSPGCIVRAETMLCSLGALAPLNRAAHQTFNREIELAVVPGGSGRLPFFATATGRLPDPVPGDDLVSASGAVSGPVSAPVAIDVDLAASAQTVGRGQTVTLTATVTDNDAHRSASGVVLTLPLPSGAIAQRVPAGCSQAGTVVLCAVGHLSGGGVVHFRVPVRFGGSGEQAATAMVRHAQVQGAPGDARASVAVRVAP